MEESQPKPPVGLIPKHIWTAQRLNAIWEAIERYRAVDKEIPIEWIQEYNQLIIKK